VWTISGNGLLFGQTALLAAGQRERLRTTQMHPCEMMTILILFHQSNYRMLKAYYTTEYV